MPKPSRPKSVPVAVQPVFQAIVEKIEPVCQQHLNAEYAYLAFDLVSALARKRPSPILRGKPEVWACAILHALGTVNFLFDKSQSPHMRSDELCAAFGVSPASASAKSKLIRDMFDMFRFNPDWTLPSMMDKNPLVWMLSVNGFIVDIRHMPREAQVVAYEQGLIPYIPADQPGVTAYEDEDEVDF